MLRKLLLKLYKKNEMESVALRRYFKKDFNIEVGMYSYGCFDQTRIPRGTIIGRYCSFAPNATIFSRNHGIRFISTHPYLYNSNLGLVKLDTIPYEPCVISDDVWFGQSSIICPGVTSIGRGSIIGAGAIVTRNVEPYTIVAGNPAVVVKSRFNHEAIELIERSKWWEMSKDDLLGKIEGSSAMIFKPTEFFSK